MWVKRPTRISFFFFEYQYSKKHWDMNFCKYFPALVERLLRREIRVRTDGTRSQIQASAWIWLGKDQDILKGQCLSALGTPQDPPGRAAWTSLLRLLTSQLKPRYSGGNGWSNICTVPKTVLFYSSNKLWCVTTTDHDALGPHCRGLYK